MNNEEKHFEIFKITLSKNLQVASVKTENDLQELTDKCVFETDTILSQYLSHTEMPEDEING